MVGGGGGGRGLGLGLELVRLGFGGGSRLGFEVDVVEVSPSEMWDTGVPARELLLLIVLVGVVGVEVGEERSDDVR